MKSIIFETDKPDSVGRIYPKKLLKGFEGRTVPVCYDGNNDPENIVGTASINVEGNKASAFITFNSTSKGVGLDTWIRCGKDLEFGSIGSGKTENNIVSDYNLEGVAVRIKP